MSHKLYMIWALCFSPASFPNIFPSLVPFQANWPQGLSLTTSDTSQTHSAFAPVVRSGCLESSFPTPLLLPLLFKWYFLKEVFPYPSIKTTPTHPCSVFMNASFILFACVYCRLKYITYLFFYFFP